MTISIWVKPDTPTTWHSTVLASDPFFRPYGIKMRGLGSALTAQCTISTSSNKNYVEADSGGIAVGNWYHIVCTYDGSTASIYVDGELKNSISKSGTLTTTTQTIFAGANPYPAHFYNGAIDDIRIWSRALSESEIQDLQYE